MNKLELFCKSHDNIRQLLKLSGIHENEGIEHNYHRECDMKEEEISEILDHTSANNRNRYLII